MLLNVKNNYCNTGRKLLHEYYEAERVVLADSNMETRANRDLALARRKAHIDGCDQCKGWHLHMFEASKVAVHPEFVVEPAKV